VQGKSREKKKALKEREWEKNVVEKGEVGEKSPSAATRKKKSEGEGEEERTKSKRGSGKVAPSEKKRYNKYNWNSFLCIASCSERLRKINRTWRVLPRGRFGFRCCRKTRPRDSQVTLKRGSGFKGPGKKGIKAGVGFIG